MQLISTPSVLRMRYAIVTVYSSCRLPSFEWWKPVTVCCRVSLLQTRALYVLRVMCALTMWLVELHWRIHGSNIGRGMPRGCFWASVHTHRVSDANRSPPLPPYPGLLISPSERTLLHKTSYKETCSLLFVYCLFLFLFISVSNFIYFLCPCFSIFFLCPSVIWHWDC
jgi:hypothetical protein